MGKKIRRRPRSSLIKLRGRAINKRWLTWAICGGKEKARNKIKLSRLQPGKWLLRRGMKRPRDCWKIKKAITPTCRRTSKGCSALSFKLLADGDVTSFKDILWYKLCLVASGSLVAR